MGKFISIFIFYSVTIISYRIHSHTKKNIFVWPGCILKFTHNTYFLEHPVILFFRLCNQMWLRISLINVQIESIMPWNSLKYWFSDTCSFAFLSQCKVCISMICNMTIFYKVDFLPLRNVSGQKPRSLMAHKNSCPNFWEGHPVRKVIKFDLFL